jgi:hypothetical protein
VTCIYHEVQNFEAGRYAVVAVYVLAGTYLYIYRKHRQRSMVQNNLSLLAAAMHSSSPMHALLLLVLLGFAALTQAVPPSRHIYFNPSMDTHYELYTQLESVLKQPSIPPYNPPQAGARYILGPRRDPFRGDPIGWIKLHITGDTPADETTLALADDDLYSLHPRVC